MDREIISLLRVSEIMEVEGNFITVNERPIAPDNLKYPNIRKTYNALVGVKSAHPEILDFLVKNNVSVVLMRNSYFKDISLAGPQFAGETVCGLSSCDTPQKRILLNPQRMSVPEMVRVIYHEYAHCVEVIERTHKGLPPMTGGWVRTNGEVKPVGQEIRAEHFRVRAAGLPPKV